MPFRYELTPKYIVWNILKFLCKFVPVQKLRKRLREMLPPKCKVFSLSVQDIEKIQEMLVKYPEVFSPEKTLAKVLKIPSFSRIGDGEFNSIVGASNIFNKFDNRLADRIKEICETGSTPQCLVCLNNYKQPYDFPSYGWFVYHGTQHLWKVLQLVTFQKKGYGDAYFLICTTQKGKNIIPVQIEKIKSLWNGRKVLFVCNQNSPVIDDKLQLFERVTLKRYLYIPDKNAFDHYKELLNKIKEYGTEWIIYLEAGATASVLAWDLSKEGYRALDMGDFYKRSLSTGKIF